jgi:predicted ATP-grasp superfamily ATP-dependent carboligase
VAGVDALRWDESRLPERLTRPVMVAAFEGWNDAADAASSAVVWLRHRYKATQLASIEPDTYYDFQAVRPTITLQNGVTRRVAWPRNECFMLTGGERDLVALSGVEPNLDWRRFCDDVLTVADRTKCEMVVTLGALIADVPHTRPVRLTGTAADDELVRRLGLERSRYEGPTGIVGVLHDACRSHGVASASLWAPVPHYVSNPPNPKATAALIERLGELLGMEIEIAELRAAAAVWQQRVDELVAADSEVSDYVRKLEERLDTADSDDLEVPSGDALAAELERFLREQHGE